MTGAPYTFDEAREHSRRASSAQQQAEQFVAETARDFALKEEAYRVALAKRIVELHDVDGLAWTVCGDVARGDPQVARLRRERDIAEGVREAASQAVWRRTADRRDTERFARWSMAIDLRGDPPEPDWSREPVIGGRRAA